MIGPVETHLVEALGAFVRASVTFVGLEPIDVLRFDRGSDVVYATVGMSRRPMADPSAVLPVGGPRAELVLRLDRRRDSVLRSLAVLAASPTVEGLVVRPGAVLRLGAPLWDGARESAVRVVPPVVVPDLGDVRFLELEPVLA